MLLLLSIICLGFGLIFALPKSLHTFSKILLFPAFGTLVFTQIFLISSFALGINNVTIAISLFLLLALSSIVYLKWREKIHFGKIRIVPYVLIVIVSVLLGTLWLRQTLLPEAGMLWTGGGGMYGDTALHAAYTSRLATGDFPPQNPLFAGNVLVYPFANDLFSAVLLKTGLNFNLAFVLPQIIFLIAFLVLFYEVATKFTGTRGFIVSLITLLLGWGVGGFIFLGQWLGNLNDFWGVLKGDVTNNPDLNLHFHNIVTGLILPERSFLPGLVLGLLFFLNYWEFAHTKRIRYLVINGVILGTLAFWHTHTFIYFSIFSVIVSIWLYYKEASRRNLIKISSTFFIALLLAIPFLILFFTNHTTEKFLSLSFGWQNGEQNIILFWFRNSLFVIPLAIIGLLFVSSVKRVFLISAFAVFVLANIVMFQPWAWDNIKLLSWCFVFFSILMTVALGRLRAYGQLGVFLIVCLVIISSVSGMFSIANQIKNRFVIYDKEDIALGNWIRENTKPNEIFIAEPIPNSPIPSLGERLLYIGYPGHLWVHGINYSSREKLNSEILSGDFSNLSKLEVAVSYIVTKSQTTFTNDNKMKELYDNGKYKVYRL